jgi:hypothetical protein
MNKKKNIIMKKLGDFVEAFLSQALLANPVSSAHSHAYVVGI